MKRGEVWWADMPQPTASEPGFRRPVLILQSDDFNRSRINTIIAAVITSNTKLAAAPGNVFLSKRSVKLGRESVVNVSQIVTLDRSFLTERSGRLSAPKIREVEEGIRLVLALNKRICLSPRSHCVKITGRVSSLASEVRGRLYLKWAAYGRK